MLTAAESELREPDRGASYVSGRARTSFSVDLTNHEVDVGGCSGWTSRSIRGR